MSDEDDGDHGPDELDRALAAVMRHQGVLGDDVVHTLRAALRALGRPLPPAGQPAPADCGPTVLPLPAAQQRKQVSVLFLDMVGSTALSAHLDPEDVHVVMDGALAAYTAVVRQFGGRVLQYAGDNLLAVFGAPVAREDDAERAVYAGLALLAQAQVQQRRVHALASHLSTEPALAVRVGIHSGEVLLGGGVDGEGTIRGQTVNLAARMEQTAPVGALRISQATWRLVRGRFDLAEQAPLLVKGSAEPLVTYLVRGPLAERVQVLRGVDGVQAALVGREEPLRRLQQAWSWPSAAQGRAARLVVVQGEPGVGKTRLVSEFLGLPAHGAGIAVKQAAVRARVQVVRAEPGLADSPYIVLRQMLWGLLAGDAAVLAADPPGPSGASVSSADVWLDRCGRCLGRAGDAAVLGQLLGLDFSTHPEVLALGGDARLLRDRGRHHATLLLQALAGQPACSDPAGPGLTLVIDDAQWCDEATLDTLQGFGRSALQVPALCLLITRPDGAARSAGNWPAERLSLIDLDRLSVADAGRLALQLLAPLAAASNDPTGAAPAPAVPQALVDLLINHSEGNPYFMEEVVNALVDRGVLDTRQRPWILQAERLTGLRLPTTLVGLLQARLDALPAEVRECAQLASIVGHHFWDASLMALSAPLPEGLDGMARHRVARPELPSRLPGLAEFSFQTHSLQQVAYDSVLKRVRPRLHAQVAQWLEAYPGAAPHELLAHHYELGGDPVAALRHWQAAAQAAAARFANPQVVAFADRALALLPDDDWVSRYDMLRLQADALAVLGRSEQRKQTLTTLLWVAAKLVRTQAVEPLGRKFGQSLLSRAQGLLARYYFDVGDFRLAQASAEECLASSVDCPPPVVANALALLAQVHARCTRFDQASILLEQALHVIKSDNDTRCLAMIHNDLGNLKSDQGDIAAAMGHYRVSLQLYKQDIYRSNQLSVRVNLGYAYLQTGDYELARSEFRQCIDYLDAVGDLIAAATARINLAMVLERLNEMTLAKREVSEAVKHLEELKDPWTLAAGLRVLGQIESCLGDYVAAQAILTRAADLCRSLELVVPLCEVMAAQVENCLRHGRLDLADQLAACVQEMLQPDWCLDGAEQPARMALVIFRARLSSDLPAARRLLGIARSNIIKQAIRFSEHVLRRKYIYGIAEHSAISTAWKAMRLRSERLD